MCDVILNEDFKNSTAFDITESRKRFLKTSLLFFRRRQYHCNAAVDCGALFQNNAKDNMQSSHYYCDRLIRKNKKQSSTSVRIMARLQLFLHNA